MASLAKKITGYRICKSKYAKDFSGAGAEKYGGLWNSIGTPMLYTAESVSLAILETLVHVPRHLLPEDLSLVTLTIEILNEPIKLALKELPNHWNNLPFSSESQKFGDKWIQSNNELALLEPSILVKQEFNMIINPRHKDFSKLSIQQIVPFAFDERLSSGI